MDRSKRTPDPEAAALQPSALIVYHFRGCPYCEDVREAARDLPLSLEWRDIHREPADRVALVAARGRGTVPVLRIVREGEPDEWMPESQDIIAYLTALSGLGRAPRPLRRRFNTVCVFGGLAALGLVLATLLFYEVFGP
jgi:glutaredoxin